MGTSAYQGPGNAESMRRNRRRMMVKIAEASQRNLVFQPGRGPVIRDLVSTGFVQESSSPFAPGVYHPTEWGWEAYERIRNHCPADALNGLWCILQGEATQRPGVAPEQFPDDDLARAAAAQARANTEGRW